MKRVRIIEIKEKNMWRKHNRTNIQINKKAQTKNTK